MLIVIPLAAADQPPAEEQPTLDHLNQAIAWYRRLAAQAQVVFLLGAALWSAAESLRAVPR